MLTVALVHVGCTLPGAGRARGLTTRAWRIPLATEHKTAGGILPLGAQEIIEFSLLGAIEERIKFL